MLASKSASREETQIKALSPLLHLSKPPLSFVWNFKIISVIFFLLSSLELLQNVLSSLARMFFTNFSNHVIFLIKILLHYAPHLLTLKDMEVPTGSDSRVLFWRLFLLLSSAHSAIAMLPSLLFNTAGPIFSPFHQSGILYVLWLWAGIFSPFIPERFFPLYFRSHANAILLGRISPIRIKLFWSMGLHYSCHHPAGFIIYTSSPEL